MLQREELDAFMQNWDPPTRALLCARLEGGYRQPLVHFDPAEASLLQAVLARLIPHREDLDLVAFLDWALERPLGRGDRPEGLPPEAELFHRGLAGIGEMARIRHGASFSSLPDEAKDEILTDLQEGRGEGETWQLIPSQAFFTRLLTKALTGYCAHPSAWLRMGFPGPSYPEGYVWISQGEIRQRRRHFPGWQTF